MKLGVSYFGNKFVRHAREDFADMVKHNCNFVVLTFSENDAQYYAETFRKIVDAAHEAGLEVYIDPWGVGGVFGGEAGSGFLAEHPDGRQITAMGLALPAACINNPAFRRFLKGWLATALLLGADGIFWDEPHFYFERHGWKVGCWCQYCRRKYWQYTGEKMPGTLTQSVKRFRHYSWVALLSGLTRTAALQQHQNIVCFVSPGEKGRSGITNWKDIAVLKSVDMIGSSPYWFAAGMPLEIVVPGVVVPLAAAARSAGKETLVWLQGFGVPKGKEGQLKRGIRLARSLGADNFAVWSYRGNECMSALASARPEKVWETIGEIYEKFST
jgi:hypothetical protein